MIDIDPRLTTIQPPRSDPHHSINDTSTLLADFDVFDSESHVRTICDPETGAELFRFQLTEEP